MKKFIGLNELDRASSYFEEGYTGRNFDRQGTSVELKFDYKIDNCCKIDDHCYKDTC